MERKVSKAWSSVMREMARRHLTYRGLVDKLAEHGIRETEANLHNKIRRGSFSGTFLIQCLVAMGVQPLNITHD